MEHVMFRKRADVRTDGLWAHVTHSRHLAPFGNMGNKNQAIDSSTHKGALLHPSWQNMEVCKQAWQGTLHVRMFSIVDSGVYSYVRSSTREEDIGQTDTNRQPSERNARPSRAGSDEVVHGHPSKDFEVGSIEFSYITIL
ncbi:hypothetical protein CBL_07338 [Carabus blaptoides fortunei]